MAEIVFTPATEMYLDPLGYGPVSVTFAYIVQGTPTTRVEFLELMEISALRHERFFEMEHMKPLRYEILRKCAEHNLKHVDWIMKKCMKGLKGVIVRNSYLTLKNGLKGDTEK